MYLAGYDFCFYKFKDHHRGGGFDRHLHAQADRLSTRHTTAVGRSRPAVRVPADGWELYTSPALLLYRNWLEREVDHSGLLRLNRGLHIEGVVRVERIRENPDEHRVQRFKDILTQAGDMVSRGEIIEDLNRIARLLDERSPGWVHGDEAKNIRERFRRAHDLLLGQSGGGTIEP